MIVRYVSTAGDDTADGVSLATAWRTLAKVDAEVGALAATDAVTVYILPGTYTGVINGVVSRPSGTADHWITLSGHPDYATRPVIDGSGQRACYELWGRSYWHLHGLAFKNIGGAVAGWSSADGVTIRDFGNTPGVGRNSHHIKLTSCDFLQFERRDLPNRLASPLIVSSFADERLGQEGCHDIEISACRFYTSKSDYKDANGNTIFAVSNCVFSGNVYDWIIHDNEFFHDMSIYMEGNGGIEFASNYNQNPGAGITTYPDQIRKGIIRDNTFTYTGPLATPIYVYGARYAIYPHACADILIERNYTDRWPIGIGLVAEKGSAPWTAQRIWVRDNVFIEPEHYALVLGTWSNLYRSVEDIWCTHNTILRTVAFTPGTQLPPISFVFGNTTDSPEGITRCALYGNLVSSADQVVYAAHTLPRGTLDHNVYVTDAAQPYRYPTFDTLTATMAHQNEAGTVIASTAPLFAGAVTRLGLRPVRSSVAVGLSVELVPPWRTPGLFGAYDDGTAETDFYGTARTSGDAYDVGAVSYLQPRTLTHDVTAVLSRRFVVRFTP